MAKNWLIKDPFMGFKITTKETHRTILTEHELGILSSKILPLKRLDQIRDVFLFSCYTGLSFSDVEKLTNDNIIIGVWRWKMDFSKPYKNEYNIEDSYVAITNDYPK